MTLYSNQYDGLFDPDWGERLRTFSFRPRTTSGGSLAGGHRSVRVGSRGEFMDRRAYVPGDDHRHIDWKAYARTDRWLMREEHEDANARVTLLLDVSGSMKFASENFPDKLLFASRLLAAFGYVLTRHSDELGWGFFSDNLRSLCPPRAGGEVWSKMLEDLQRPPSGSTTDFKASFRQFPSSERSSVVVVSDFWGELPELEAGLEGLARGRDVVAFQVLDPAELEFRFHGARRFEGLESSSGLSVDAGLIAESYRVKMAQRQTALKNIWSRLSIDGKVFRTDEPLVGQLASFLERR